MTPLHAAAYHNYKDTVPLLVSKGADVNAKDRVSAALILLNETPVSLLLFSECNDEFFKDIVLIIIIIIVITIVIIINESHPWFTERMDTLAVCC